jgi:hypothetical protein
MNYVERLLAKLRGVHGGGDGRYTALCPAHDDRSPSLGVSVAEDGRVLLRCFAGCETQKVLDSLALTWEDLYPGPDEEPVAGAVANQEAGRAPALPEAAHHDIYRDFLDLLNLAPLHKDQLRARGLTEEAVRDNGYKSLGWQEAVAALAGLERKYGRERLLQVPGFRLNRYKDVEPVISAGLLIPVRGPDGRILGCQVRADEGSAKYLWFSGDGSPSCGSPCHVRDGVRDTDQVLVVEGPLKADVVRALQPQYRVLGVAGVSGWKAALPVLQHWGVKDVVLAYDADWTTNEAVGQALRKAADGLAAAGIVCQVAIWNINQGKGLDDLLKAGGTYSLLPPAEAFRARASTAPEVVTPPPARASRSTPRATSPSDRTPLVSRGDEVELRRVTWLWKPWLPEGSIVLLEGDAGQGKGFFVTDLAARLTTNRPMPGPPTDRAYGGGNVLFITSEDSYAKTILPRFVAAGGDRSRLFLFEGVKTKGGAVDSLALPLDIDRLADVCSLRGVRLVVFDPLSAFLDVSIDTNQDSQVRRILSPLFQWVDRTGVCVVGIRHFNKSSGMKAIHKGLGSVAFVAQSRVTMVVLRDPEGGQRQLVLQSKNSFASRPKGLAFSFEPGVVAIAGQDEPVPHLAWLGEVDRDPDELVDARPVGKGALSEAAHFLEQVLAEGPVAQREVERLASDAGHSRRTLARAKDEAGLTAQLVYTPAGKKLWAWAGKTWDWSDRKATLRALGEGDADDQTGVSTTPDQPADPVASPQKGRGKGRKGRRAAAV